MWKRKGQSKNAPSPLKLRTLLIKTLFPSTQISLLCVCMATSSWTPCSLVTIQRHIEKKQCQESERVRGMCGQKDLCFFSFSFSFFKKEWVSQAKLATVNNFGGFWGIGPCSYLTLGWLGQVRSDLECRDTIKEVVRNINFELVSFHIVILPYEFNILGKVSFRRCCPSKVSKAQRHRKKKEQLIHTQTLAYTTFCITFFWTSQAIFFRSYYYINESSVVLKKYCNYVFIQTDRKNSMQPIYTIYFPSRNYSSLIKKLFSLLMFNIHKLVALWLILLMYFYNQQLQSTKSFTSPVSSCIAVFFL